MLLYIELG